MVSHQSTRPVGLQPSQPPVINGVWPTMTAAVRQQQMAGGNFLAAGGRTAREEKDEWSRQRKNGIQQLSRRLLENSTVAAISLSDTQRRRRLPQLALSCVGGEGDKGISIGPHWLVVRLVTVAAKANPPKAAMSWFGETWRRAGSAKGVGRLL